MLLTRLTLLSALFIGAAAAYAADPRLDAPTIAVETAKTAAPEVFFETVTVAIENGEALYEFHGVDQNGNAVDVNVRADGVLREIRRAVAIEDVPDPVRSALAQTAPGFEPDAVTTMTRDDAELAFRFKGRYDGEPFDIVIAQTGEVREFEDITAR